MLDSTIQSGVTQFIVGHAEPVVSVTVTQLLLGVVVGGGAVTVGQSRWVSYAVPHAPWQAVGQAV
jgi:hypothetical protein